MGVSSQETTQTAEKNLAIVSVISRNSHSNYVLCTALPLLSAPVHSTTQAFLLFNGFD